MSGILRLPAPPAQYDRRDQAETRRALAEFLASVQGLPTAGPSTTAFSALTFSGLTSGQALVASGAATAGFRALLAADIGAGTFGTGDFFFQSRVQVGSLPTSGANLLANFAAARLLSGRTTVGGSEYLGFAYADHARMILGRANGTPASPTGPLNGEVLGSLYFGGHNAAHIFTGAEVEGLAEEDYTSPPGAKCGSRLRLRTVPIGSTTLTERFTIRAAGDLEPGADNAYNIGAVALRIKDLYATTLHGALAYGNLTYSGLTSGHALVASGATSAAFRALTAADIGAGTFPASTFNFTATVTMANSTVFAVKTTGGLNNNIFTLTTSDNLQFGSTRLHALVQHFAGVSEQIQFYASNAATLCARIVTNATVLSSRVSSYGDFVLETAGGGYKVKEGTNATMGIATLVAGTVVVNTTKVTANSRIFLTRETNAGTIGGSVDVTARTAGTSFTITSGNALDTSTVAWLILEPA